MYSNCVKVSFLRIIIQKGELDGFMTPRPQGSMTDVKRERATAVYNYLHFHHFCRQLQCSRSLHCCRPSVACCLGLFQAKVVPSIRPSSTLPIGGWDQQVVGLFQAFHTNGGPIALGVRKVSRRKDTWKDSQSLSKTNWLKKVFAIMHSSLS